MFGYHFYGKRDLKEQVSNDHSTEYTSKKIDLNTSIRLLVAYGSSAAVVAMFSLTATSHLIT